jgi:Short C-terminal domain
MLFLLRPPQTYVRYSLPRDPRQQEAWNQEVQHAYGSTRRVAPATPASTASDDLVATLKDLGELHRSGALTDDEFAAAKARLLAQQDA